MWLNDEVEEPCRSFSDCTRWPGVYRNSTPPNETHSTDGGSDDTAGAEYGYNWRAALGGKVHGVMHQTSAHGSLMVASRPARYVTPSLKSDVGYV